MEIIKGNQGLHQGQELSSKISEMKDICKDFSTLDGKTKEDFTKNELDESLKKLNKYLEEENTHAEYEVHEKFKDIMIKIVDNTTKEVILEVPPRKILDVVAKLCEITGIVFDKKA